MGHTLSGGKRLYKGVPMPWRLLGFIILCGIFLIFIGFNQDNPCTIWFGVEIKDVPIYLPVFTAFVLGMLCSIPFIVSLRRKKEKAAAIGADPAAPARKKWGKSKPPAGGPSGGGGVPGGGADGSYGID
jgi:uncharacterized integral membrane protein